MNKFNKKVPSKFAPIFIASTAIFFLGSAFKFIFNKDNATDRHQSKQDSSSQSNTQDNLEREEDENEAHEPEEDLVQSL